MTEFILFFQGSLTSLKVENIYREKEIAKFYLDGYLLPDVLFLSYLMFVVC